MAPGLRSGRAGLPGVAGAGGAAGRPPRGRDAGGAGRYGRRAGAAGMLARCLLSAGMLALLARCALAAQERNIYDASGSSSDPTVTAVPARPLADPSAADETFSAAHSAGDSGSEREGLSGQPAFSSVLTVMAGTVKHPVSLSHSRTSPTITRDETHTTQWPSHSSTQGSEMSSSPLSVGANRSLLESSGQTSPVSEPLHVSLMDGQGNVSVFSSSSSSPSSLSPSIPSTSSLLPSVLSLFSPSTSTQWSSKASLSQGQRPVSSSDSQAAPAKSLGWTKYPTNAHSKGPLREIQTSETSDENSNKVTVRSPHTSAEKIHGVSGAHISRVSTQTINTPANSTYSSHATSNIGQSISENSHRATQTHHPGVSSDLADNGERSTSTTFSQDSQAAQRQRGASQNPTPALQSSQPKGYSFFSRVTEHLLERYVETEDKTSLGSQTFAKKSTGNPHTSPPHSHVINPSASMLMTFSSAGSSLTLSPETKAGETSLSETAIREVMPNDFGTLYPERASNAGDLLMAAGQRSTRGPAININHSHGETEGSVPTQAHPLSLAQLHPESTAGSMLRLIASAGTTSSSSESDSLHLPSNEVKSVQGFATQTGYLNTQHEGLTKQTTIFPSSSGMTVLFSWESSNGEDVLYETKHENLSQPTRPAYLLPSFLSHSPNQHSPTRPPVNSEAFPVQPKVSMSSPIPASQRPFPTKSLLTFPHTYDVTLPTTKSGVTAVLLAENIQSERANLNLNSLDRQMSAAHAETSTNDHGRNRNRPTEGSHKLTVDHSISPLSERQRSTLITDVEFYEGVPSGRFPFMTTKDILMLNKGSEGFSRRYPREVSSPPVTFDATFKMIKNRPSKKDVTVTEHYKQPSSSWSGSILTRRANNQGIITSETGDKSDFHLGISTTGGLIASSSEGQSSAGTLTAIYSFGTKRMAPYTTWKATKAEPFQNSTFELENVSTAFDWENSNFQADGPSYEHPKLEDGQHTNAHMLHSTYPTVAASNPYSFHPSNDFDKEYVAYFGSTSQTEEQSGNLSPFKLRSAASVSTVHTHAPLTLGSGGALPLSHTTRGSIKSLQANTFTLAYKYKHSPPPADADSPKSVFDAAVTAPNDAPHMFSDVPHIHGTVEAKKRALASPAKGMPSSSFSPSSSHSKGVSLSGVTAPYVSPVNMTTPLSWSLLSTRPPQTASSSVSVKPTFPPLPSTPASPTETPQEVTTLFFLHTAAETDELTAGTSRAVVPTFPKEKEASLPPSQSAGDTLFAEPTERTSQVSPLTPRQDTTTASVKLTTTASTTRSKSADTTTPPLRSTSMQTTTTTTAPPATTFSRRTTTVSVRAHTSRRIFTPPVPRTTPPRAATTAFISPFTTTTEAPPQQCNITERMWVRTVVSIYVRRNRLDSIQRQNLRRGLSQGLRKALNDSAAQAQVETVFGSPNMTVAYHVTGGDMVYSPSILLAGLDSYGRDKLIADLRQYLPMVTALPIPVALWRPSPASGFQLKTVLQFVGAGDDPHSCRFSQMMEQRLEKVFYEAQAKVLHSHSRLSVQMLSVSQAAGYPAVSLVYAVKNGSVFLNGTTASNLLGQLSAELVGYFLFYPPLIIAEPLEYHNLNTSVATRDFWVITVIQDVDNASLEGQYQSFASLMEQRLAELFVLAGQQGTRFRRATTVGSYTVQMVSIHRVSGIKNPAEMTYYVQHNGVPLSGTSAAKVLNTVDSQTMALTLGYFVQLQAEPVVKNPPNNLWIIAAVLAPIAVVTLIIIIITAVLCRKNKNDFKADAIGNLNPRAKMAYRRDVGYYHQPVQGFDYAKQHLGQQGGDEETLPVSQDTLVMSLQIRDTPLSMEKSLQKEGSVNRKSLTSEKHKSKLPSEDGSVISNESEKLNSGRGLTVPKVTAQQKLTREEMRKRDDPYDTSSGSLQLISIKPMAAQPNYSHHASSDRSHDSAIVNGEVSLALKQKSDIEHYRNKLRLKAKRKGYYDFPSADGTGRTQSQRHRHCPERAVGEHGRPLEPDDERGSTYVKSHRRHSQVGQTDYRSRQSLSSPSPGGTEMDLLVMRERPRKGIRNSGYDTEPELIEETNVDRLVGQRGYMYGRGLKGHSETSTLSSQPSIDEVRQQMHLLLEEAFSLASGGQSTSGRHSHHHHPSPEQYNAAPPPLPYADVVTSAPGTMSCERGGLQWVPSYGTDMYQCSLPKPAFRFTQLPDMAMSSPPPLPPRAGQPPGTSLRRSTSDLGPKGRSSETSVTELQSQHDNNPYAPATRAALPSIAAEQPVSNYSGNPITAVYAIPATRPGYSEYFVSTPPMSYHSPSWMSYPPEPEDVPPQWADSVPLPGYVEAFPHPRYPQGSPTRLALQYNQSLEQPATAPSTASQQSLPQVVKDMDSMPLSSLSTSALVQAIRQEVAKLAKKQNDIFEF